MYVKKNITLLRRPIEKGLDMLGGKWKSRILCVLAQRGPIRYGQFKQEMTNVTDTALSVTLKELIREHVELTGSPRGKEILDNFSEFLPKFKKVLPYDYDRMLRVIASVEERGLDGEQAQIEAFYTVQKKK